MFAETQAALKALIGLRRPDDWHATMITSTGTGANEASLRTLGSTGPGLILRNGFFAARLVDQACQGGLEHQVLDGPQDRPLDADAVDAYLEAHPGLKWCYFVAHETRTGIANPLEAIGQVCKRHGLLVGSDIVSSAYAYPVDLEAAGLDLATTSSAKAIMAAPGIGIVMTRLASLPLLGRGNVYYLDLVAECDKQRKEQQPRFAQPVALHAGLWAACRHLLGIGIDAHFARIQRQMGEIERHLASMGIRPLVERAHRSNIAVNFGLPAGLTYPELAEALLAEGYYVLYGIPGDSTHFQVSTIGDLEDEHVAGICRALTTVLARGQLRSA